jgi:hypothetical protein
MKPLPAPSLNTINENLILMQKVSGCSVLSNIQFNQLFKEKVKNFVIWKTLQTAGKVHHYFILLIKKTKPNTNLNSMTHITIYKQ